MLYFSTKFAYENCRAVDKQFQVMFFSVGVLQFAGCALTAAPTIRGNESLDSCGSWEAQGVKSGKRKHWEKPARSFPTTLRLQILWPFVAIQAVKAVKTHQTSYWVCPAAIRHSFLHFLCCKFYEFGQRGLENLSMMFLTFAAPAERLGFAFLCQWVFLIFRFFAKFEFKGASIREETQCWLSHIIVFSLTIRKSVCPLQLPQKGKNNINLHLALYHTIIWVGRDS